MRVNTLHSKRIVLTTLFVLLYSILATEIAPAHASTLAVTRYVSPTGTDQGDCTSASSPCRTIQYAVNRSFSGDRVLVAKGTYTYRAASDTCSILQTRAIVCIVDKMVSIFGGYSTSNWSTSSPSTNLTVIDGQEAYRGVHLLGYQTTNANLDMEGFTIQNGRAQGPLYVSPYNATGFGGGMWISHATITLRDMIFKNNQAVGANTTAGAGGDGAGAGLVIESSPAGASSLLERVTFDSNQSLGGVGPDRGGVAFGAFFAANSTVTAKYVTFTDNQAIGGNSSGGGTSGGLNADSLGGGAGFENGKITLQHVTATGNKATGGNASTSGGNAFGAGIFGEGVTAFSISDSYIANNISQGANAVNGGVGAGGGISFQNVQSTIVRTQVIANQAIGGNSTTGRGHAGSAVAGGLYTFATGPGYLGTFTNLLIADNLATMGTSGDSQQGGGGGGIAVQGQQANITHVTIARNRLGPTLVSGEGLLVLAQVGATSGSANINYSIIANHTVGGTGSGGAPAVLVQQGNAATFNRGLFAGNTKDTNADGKPMAAGTFNGLSTMLSTSSAGFFSPGSPNYNYHLRLDSSAKDQATGGSTADDIDRQARPYASISDIGSDEYWPFPLQVTAGNGSLHADWTQGASLLMGGVDHYEILVTCASGAHPPKEVACGQPLDVGTATHFDLSELSNYEPYTIVIHARDVSGNLIATSTMVTTSPTDRLLYLPLIIR